MSQITVWPDNLEVEFDDDVNLLDTLLAAGVPIAHLCGGKARCSTCRVRVTNGLDHLGPRTEKEQAMSDRLQFPDEVRLACQCSINGSADVWRLVLDTTDIELASQLGKPKLKGGVGREVRIAAMFTDIVGYTAMAEALPAYDVVHILNRFFQRSADVVRDLGGVVDNYIGDAFLAVFPSETTDNPAQAAIEAAIGVRDIADDLTTYLSMIYRHDFGVRTGIAYGEAIFGMMGSGARARETVIGDVVNTASRLEAANKQTGTNILVGDAVRQDAAPGVVYGETFELDLKGLTGLVTAHSVLSIED